MLARAIKWHEWLQQLSLVKHTYGLLNYDYLPTYKHADVTLICSLWILPSLTRSFRCRGTRNTKKYIYLFWFINQYILVSILARIQCKIWNSSIKLSKHCMQYYIKNSFSLLRKVSLSLLSNFNHTWILSNCASPEAFRDLEKSYSWRTKKRNNNREKIIHKCYIQSKLYVFSHCPLGRHIFLILLLSCYNKMAIYFQAFYPS